MEPTIKSSYRFGQVRKLMNVIKKYHFTNYVWSDFDINQLLRATKRIEKSLFPK